jgi:hypothetical protein
MTPWDDVQRVLGRIEASQEHLAERIAVIEARLEMLCVKGHKTRHKVIAGGGLMGFGAICMEAISRMVFG